jgi:signal peptidase I
MAPGLIGGDNVMIFKPLIGARLFNLFTSIRGEQVKIYRMPGFRKIRRNDVVVFNYPYPKDWNKIEMHIMKYYVKRCIGLPGDSLEIRNGFYQVKGLDMPLGNVESQQKVATREDPSFAEDIYRTVPQDSLMDWNIKDFGPLYIPKKGDVLPLNRVHCLLYKKLMEWEQGNMLEYKDSLCYLNGQMIDSYCFQKNYYFVAGDRVEDSRDSRYWGLLPEEYIVGKAWIIWKSTDPRTAKFRWERFLKAAK